MSSTSSPYGLRPVSHPSGLVRATELVDGIASAYGTAIKQGALVKYATGGVIQAAAAGDRCIGAFAGCMYTTSDGRRVITNQWVANTAYVTGSMIAVFYEDPLITYAIQADGSIAQTGIGDQADISNATAGNSTTGISATTLSASLTGGASAQLRVTGLLLTPDNAWGDAYTDVLVQISEHQFVASVSAL